MSIADEAPSSANLCEAVRMPFPVLGRKFMLSIIRPLRHPPGCSSKRGRPVAVLSHSLAAFGQSRGAVLTVPSLTVEE
jgi:hypothetical protein